MAATVVPSTSEKTLDQGFKNAKSAVRSMFRDAIWMTGNLSKSKRRELDSLGAHLVRCLDMLYLESTEGLPLDIWREIRDELSDAFCGRPQSPEQAALAQVVQRRAIPKQYIFDMVNASDFWIRFRKFDTWEQLDTFASNLGGSAMVSACHVFGVVKPDFEIPALHCGKAILLTQLLANCVTDLKSNRNFLTTEDFDRFKLEVHRVKMKQDCPELKHFIRFNVARLEKLFMEAGQLVSYLDLDGARTVTSLLCMHWRILVRLKLHPESVYMPQGILTRRDLLGLKSRHILGTEGGIPILPQNDGHH